MSSHYGSYIHLDDLVSIEQIQPGTATVSTPINATPRVPLKARDVNVLATPPSSQRRKRNDRVGNVIFQVCETGQQEQRTQALATPFITPNAYLDRYSKYIGRSSNYIASTFAVFFPATLNAVDCAHAAI